MRPFQERGIFNKKNNPNLPSEEKKVFPSKYIQMKYPFLNEVVPKNSILYKVKYKPDFSTNEYIKNTKKDSFQSINLTNKKNYIIQNKNFEENTNSTLLNELEENKVQNQYYNNIDYNILDNNFYDNKNLYEVSPIRDSENIQINDINISQKVLVESKFSNNSNSKNKNKINHIESQSQNLLNSNNNNNKISERYNYLKSENIVKKVNKVENELGYKYIKIKNERNNEILIEPKLEENIQNNNNYKIRNLYLKFNNNNSNKNIYHNYIQNSEELKSSLTNLVNEHSKVLEDLINDSFKDKNYKSNQLFSSEQLENKNNYNNTKKFDYINTNTILNVKLKEIRIKLSKEFYKYFIQICKIYTKKHFLFFIKQIKNNNENIFFNNKKNNCDGYKEILSTNNSVDIYKNTTLNKNETLYRKINKRTLNDNKLNSNNISVSSKNKYYIKSVPRLKKLKDLSINKNNMSVNRNPNNKLLESNSLSPSLRIGNKIIINRDISFKNEGNIKENELYRDSRELNKKFRQIQTRKIRSKNKNNKNNITTNENELKIEIKSDIDSQFNEIRKYIKSVKKERKNHNKNKSGKKILTAIINNNTENLIKLNTIEPNERNNYKSNILNNNYDYSNQTYDKPKYIKNALNLNKHKSFNIKNNNTIINSNSISFNNTNVNNYNIHKSNHLNYINNDSQQSSTFNSLSSADFNIKNKNIYYSKDIQGKTIKLQNIKKINTNNSFNDHQIYNLFSSNRNHLYNSKTIDNEHKKNSNKRIKVFSMLIKNIVTKDKRIFITITYYFLLRKNKPLINRYDYLVPSEIFSLNLKCNNKNYKSKENLKLSEIKEEEFQNSKFHPEVQKMNFEKMLSGNYDKKIAKYFRNENIYEESDNYGKKSKNKINNNQ